MNRNEVIERLLKEKTGRTFSGRVIWEEIERAAGEAEEGSHWIAGQDDNLEKWEYYVEITRTYDPDFDQWETSISLEEIKIEDKKTCTSVYVQVKGAKI